MLLPNSYPPVQKDPTCGGISNASPTVGSHGTSWVGSTSTRENPRHAEAEDGAFWAGPFVWSAILRCRHARARHREVQRREFHSVTGGFSVMGVGLNAPLPSTKKRHSEVLSHEVVCR